MSENIPLKEWLVAAGKANMTTRVSDQYGCEYYTLQSFLSNLHSN